MGFLLEGLSLRAHTGAQELLDPGMPTDPPGASCNPCLWAPQGLVQQQWYELISKPGPQQAYQALVGTSAYPRPRASGPKMRGQGGAMPRLYLVEYQ